MVRKSDRSTKKPELYTPHTSFVEPPAVKKGRVAKKAVGKSPVAIQRQATKSASAPVALVKQRSSKKIVAKAKKTAVKATQPKAVVVRGPTEFQYPSL